MVYRFSKFAVDTSAREVRRAGQVIDIEPRAFELLVYLLERRERAVGKDELQDKVWGTVVSDSAMTRSVMKLRKSLGDNSESIVKTVPKFGYRFVAQIREDSPAIGMTEKRVPRPTLIATMTGVVLLLALLLSYVMFDKQEIVDKSVAVLPFDDLSEAQDQQWFADGLAEEILNSLSRTPDLFVASRTSSFAFRKSQLDVSAIADSLGVAHILEGSVRRDGEKLRVTAQLIRADDGFHIWSQNFDHSYADLISIQEAVAIEIAVALQTTMDPVLLEKFVSSGTLSVAAYEEYLKGLADFDAMVASGNVETYTGSISRFEQAVEIDPGFGTAWYEIADFWASQLSITGILGGQVDVPRNEMTRRYEVAMENAIRYADDPTTVLGYRASQAHNAMQLRKALQLNWEYLLLRPNDHWARDRHKVLLGKLNRDAELIQYTRDVFELDKHNVVSMARSLLGLAFSGDRDAAEAMAMATADRLAFNAIGLYQLHRAYLWSGNIARAGETFEKLMASDMPAGNLHMARLRQLCAEGRIDEATELHTAGQQMYADDIMVDWISHTVMGEHAEAVEAWRSYDEQDVTMFNGVLQYPTFDPSHYSNLMAHLAEHGDEPGPVLKVPFRCND